MGKNLKGKELGKGITQRKNGVYHGRYVDRFGARRSVYGTTVKEVKAEAGRGGTKRTKAVKYC
ncbi:MAG: integrase DNA-binding domain-containing protein [Blautia faecis]